MKSGAMAKLLVVGVVAVSGNYAMAQGRTDVGKHEYDNNCAVCHAVSGKGQGPYTEFLSRSAPDLTTLSRRNGGVFPVARIYDVIEGAGVGHGTRDMPIWGQHYRIKAAEYYGEVDYNPEAVVRGRILSLIEYINRLQAK